MESLNYKLIRRAQKTMMLKIVGGELIVYVNQTAKLDDVERFISKHIRWIKKNLYKQNNTLNTIKLLEENGQILLFGALVDLPMIKSSQKESAIKFYLANRDYLISRINDFAERLKISVKKIGFSKSKTCWGVCNSKNEIRLNERLCSLPKNLIDYVILHELAHVIYYNHSKQFWNLLETWLPNCKNYRKELRNYSFILSIYK